MSPEIVETPTSPAVASRHLFDSFCVWLPNLRHWKTARAYRDLTRAMQRDPDYAHGWQCNIACPLMDEGMSHADANKAADRLMRHLFGIKSNDQSPDAGAKGKANAL